MFRGLVTIWLCPMPIQFHMQLNIIVAYILVIVCLRVVATQHGRMHSMPLGDMQHYNNNGRPTYFYNNKRISNKIIIKVFVARNIVMTCVRRVVCVCWRPLDSPNLSVPRECNSFVIEKDFIFFPITGCVSRVVAVHSKSDSFSNINMILLYTPLGCHK